MGTTRNLAPLIFALTACRGGGGTVEAPAPSRQFTAQADTISPAPSGIIVAPLSLDLGGAIAALEQEVPKRFGDIERRIPLTGSKRRSFAFAVRREPFAVSFSGDTVFLSAVIHYKGRGWYDPPIGPTINGECGTSGDPPRARLVLRAVPQLSEDWHLRIRPRLVGVNALTKTERDQCEVSFLHLDVTERVLDGAEQALRKLLPGVERKISRLDVQTPLERIWWDLQQPIRLTDSLWLVLQPKAVHLGAIRGSRDTVAAEVGVGAAPRIVTGTRPEVPTIPLPPLSPMVGDEGFSFLVEGAFDYDVMSAGLTKRLAGKSVKAGGRRVVVQRVTVYGIAEGRLALGLDFSGSANGRIWFLGAPSYDPGSGMLSVPDLDFDAQSSDLLVKGVAWLKAGAIRQYLRDQAKVPAGELLRRVEGMAVKQMNRSLAPGVRLSAMIERSEPAGILVREKTLVIRARARGRARLDLGPQLFVSKNSGK